MVSSASFPPPVYCERITGILRGSPAPSYVLASRSSVRLPRLFSSYLAIGDEVAFAVTVQETRWPEILVTKAGAAMPPCLYLVPVGYAGQPRADRQGQAFVSAEIPAGKLGLTTVHLPCKALAEYFYRLPSADAPMKYSGLYELLRVEPGAAPAELRVAFKLRSLEMAAAGEPRWRRRALERAFNILGQPDLRACHDALLADPRAPAVFPYGGFGALLASGERSHDGTTFLARRILAFLPEPQRRHFHFPLRNCDFYDDRGLCRDVVRKLEFWIDPAVLHVSWDASWNRWKHLLGTQLEVDATFVRSRRWRTQKGAPVVVQWETALPSRVAVRLPPDFEDQLQRARSSYLRFGQYSRALDQIRICLKHRAVERAELQGMCADLHLPPDFDVAQINWQPDYDEFFYRHLSRHARRLYLLRGEYIFDLEKTVVAETPKRGHATYVFAKPRNMEDFLLLYSQVGKQDICRNRGNTGERLGFLKRVVHGANPAAWRKELDQSLGGETDCAPGA